MRPRVSSKVLPLLDFYLQAYTDGLLHVVNLLKHHPNPLVAGNLYQRISHEF